MKQEPFSKSDSSMTWRSKLKIRAWVFVIGVPLAIVGVISISPAWLTFPLVGVAVAAVTMTVNKVGQRLSQPTCWTCGEDLREEAPAEHGIVCPSCGALNQFFLAQRRPAPTLGADDDARDDDAQA
jgi:hypothetical protein